jgi:glycosyltransferase involved in cell wall biosynthesis
MNMSEAGAGAGAEPILFTVGLIVKNEEKTLPYLQASLREFMEAGGEVVILDTGSTDETVHVARSLGIKAFVANKVFQENLSQSNIKNIRKRHIEEDDLEKAKTMIRSEVRFFNFGAARNELHKYVSNKILLQLDGCDTMEYFDFRFINQKIKEGVTRFEYLQIYSGIQLNISRFYHIDREKWQCRTHEILTHNEGFDGIFSLPHEIMTVVHNYQPKPRSYLEGLFADVLEMPNNTRTLYYLGRELLFQGLHQSAIKMLRKYTGQTDAWIPEKSSGFCLIAQAYENMGDFSSAFQAYNDAFITFNGWREPLLKMGRLCQRTDEFQRGLCYAVAALSIERKSAFAEPVGNYLGLPHEIAYWGYHFTGRRKEACMHWRLAIAAEPTHDKYNHDRQFFEVE